MKLTRTIVPTIPRFPKGPASRRRPNVILSECCGPRGLGFAYRRFARPDTEPGAHARCDLATCSLREPRQENQQKQHRQPERRRPQSTQGPWRTPRDRRIALRPFFDAARFPYAAANANTPPNPRLSTFFSIIPPRRAVNRNRERRRSRRPRRRSRDSCAASSPVRLFATCAELLRGHGAQCPCRPRKPYSATTQTNAVKAVRPTKTATMNQMSL